MDLKLKLEYFILKAIMKKKRITINVITKKLYS